MNRMMPSYMPMQDLTKNQDVSGIQPMYQNIGNQQANQRQAMQEAIGLTNQAGMTVQGKQAGAGMNPVMMAMLLRQNNSNPYTNAYNAMQQYGPSNVYGYGGMGQVPTTTTGMD